jgi:hypothetical protein
MVHIEAEKHGIEKIDKSMLPNVIEVLKSGGHMLLSLVVLIGPVDLWEDSNDCWFLEYCLSNNPKFY